MIDHFNYVSDINTGVIKTHYEVVAIYKPEGIYNFVNYFDDLDSAKQFCLKQNYKYDLYCSYGVYHDCELKIIKVISEVL